MLFSISAFAGAAALMVATYVATFDAAGDAAGFIVWACVVVHVVAAVFATKRRESHDATNFRRAMRPELAMITAWHSSLHA